MWRGEYVPALFIRGLAAPVVGLSTLFFMLSWDISSVVECEAYRFKAVFLVSRSVK